VRLRASRLGGEERGGDGGLLVAGLLLLLVIARSATVEASKQLLEVRHGEGGLGQIWTRKISKGNKRDNSEPVDSCALII
jgi:hypothetical protein